MQWLIDVQSNSLKINSHHVKNKLVENRIRLFLLYLKVIIHLCMNYGVNELLLDMHIVLKSRTHLLAANKFMEKF